MTDPPLELSPEIQYTAMEESTAMMKMKGRLASVLATVNCDTP
jgi:hypothetical protein